MIFRWYDSAYKKHPFTAAGSTMAIKAGLCDFIAQKLSNPSCDLDYFRAAKFSFFCISYVGCFQHMVFNILYPRLFPGSGWKTALKKTLFDNFVHSPFVYLPAYYSYKGLIELQYDSGNVTGSGVSAAVASGLQEYREKGLSVLYSCWGLWIPAQLINFAIIPPNFRILYNAAVGCLWEVYLSSTSPCQDVDSNSRRNSDLDVASDTA